MAVNMPLPERISQSAIRRKKQRLFVARFGEGYFQTAADGSESKYEEWDISWDALDLTERNTVIAALERAGTEQLLWTPTNDPAQKKYVIQPNKNADLYTENQQSGSLFTISTSIIQVR